jgi:hypothetical protein
MNITSSHRLVVAGSRSFYVLKSEYVTGTDRCPVRGRTVFHLTRPFNTRYAVKYPFFALILALYQDQIITNLTIHTSSSDL